MEEKRRGECYFQALYLVLLLFQVPALAHQAVSPPSHPAAADTVFLAQLSFFHLLSG